MTDAPTRRMGRAAALFAILTIQAAPAPPAPPAPRGPRPAPTRADLNRPLPRGRDDAEIAGLPRGSRPPVLDWERAYALALIRSRAERPAHGRALAEALDPDALAEQAKRYDVGDFARFRKEFLADPGEGEGGFRDPSGAMFDLLRRLQAVEMARWNVASFENLVVALRSLIEEASSGLSQLQLDRAEEGLQQARLQLVDETGRFRDRLDALKVQLGLAPHAPIVLDKQILAGFREAFEEADRWCHDPKNTPVDLPPIAAQLPALDDVVIDGHSVSALISARGPIDLEEVLAAGTRLALKDRARKGDPVRRELRVRGAIRRLSRIQIAYEIERRRFVLVLRAREQAQEHLLAPPRRGESQRQGAALIADLIGAQGQIQENQDRLVALWAEYQALRLALFRDLGTLPYDDWKPFHDQLTARRSGSNP